MKSEELLSKIDGIIPFASNRSTFFQLTYFILAKEPTNQAKLHRCAAELRTLRKSMSAATLELEDIKDRIELLRWEMAEVVPDNKGKIVERQMRRKITHLREQHKETEQQLAAFEEQCVFWVEAFEVLSKQEKPKSWDDPAVQLEYWNAKYEREIKERILLQLPLDIDLIRSALSMPNDANIKQQVEQLLLNQEKKLLKKE